MWKDEVGAVRVSDLKMHLAGAALKPEIFHMIRDPAEKRPGGAAYLWAIAPFKQLVQSHMMRVRQFQHREAAMGAR